MRNHRSRIAIALTVALALPSAVLLADAPARPKPARKRAESGVRMKLATVAPSGSSIEKILQEMAQRWRDTPGGVDLTIYAGAVKGGEAEAVRSMSVGALDAALLTAIGISEIDPSVEALQSIPMLFRSLEEVDHVATQLRPEIEARLRRKGYVVLFWGDAGWVRFFSKERVVTPDDLRKTKLFTSTGSTAVSDIYKAAGFKPVLLDSTSILPSLQTGMIDAVPLPPVYANALQVYDRAPHMLELNWAPLAGALVVTERAWNKLEPAAQRELARAAAEAGSKMKAVNRRESDDAVRAMAARKLQVHRVTPEVEAQWRELAERVYPQIRGKVVPADLFDEVQRIVKEYRQAGQGR